MLAQIKSFLRDYANADIGVVTLAEVRLIVQGWRQWLGTSLDGMTLLVDCISVKRSTPDGLLSLQGTKELLDCCSEYYNKVHIPSFEVSVWNQVSLLLTDLWPCVQLNWKQKPAHRPPENSWIVGQQMGMASASSAWHLRTKWWESCASLLITLISAFITVRLWLSVLLFTW